MTCQEFWNTMPELGSGAAHSDHVRQCPACASLLERQRSLSQGLRAAAGEWSRVEAPPRLEARLTAAFRSHNGLAHDRRRMWPTVLVWAAAAASVLALAFFLVRGRQPMPAQRRAPSAMELAGLEPAGVVDTGDDSADADSGFILLPNMERIGPNEDVNLVRVELPRSSMIAVGYAVSAERASEPVVAEVMLGADGLAHAVRFLDE
ncbi:MAG TPA: hypothetical protein VE959_30965 [Bryobacteraceae bacterium]|nr:hypothetical protein [Bryobacteraceae bacterium]